MTTRKMSLNFCDESFRIIHKEEVARKIIHILTRKGTIFLKKNI